MTATALRVEEQAAPYLVAPPLTDHLDTYASAPEGFKRLRELVLNLAVRGRLVPQDPKDEPAREILQRLARENAYQLAAKPEITIHADEVEQPYELPAGWEWVRLAGIGGVGSSSRVHQKDWTTSGVPFYRAREIVRLSSSGFVDNELFISEDHFQRLSSHGSVPETNDIMITGVGTIGIPYVVRATDRFYFKDASVLIFKNRQGLPPEFLLCLMKSPYWIKQIHVGSMGTTVHTLTIGRVSEIPVPLPPLAEQSRIVAKVDELMALIDALEAKVGAGETARGKLLDSLLTALADSPDAAATADAWAQLAPHFDLLLQTPADVDRLQQTLLSLAVKGRLVPQNPKDEPTAELLKRIRAEKARLVAEGKIKRDRALPAIGKDEEDYRLPTNWEWVRLADLVVVLNGRAYSRDELLDSGTPVLRVGNLFTSDKWYYSNLALDTDKYCDEGDLLYSWSASFGPFLWKGPRVIYHYHIWKLQFISSANLSKEFLYNFLLEKTAEIKAAGHGVSMVHMTKEKMEKILVPLPPLAEQSRIVAAVASLTALCDRLRSRLAARRDLSAKLATALTESALA